LDIVTPISESNIHPACDFRVAGPMRAAFLHLGERGTGLGPVAIAGFWLAWALVWLLASQTL